MAIVPSKYQKVVYIYIEKGKGNAVIDAVAGSGKSTTIVNALKLIPKNKRVLFLAFNKAIVEELKIKVGNLNNVDIKTLHSLGASATMRALNSQLQPDKYTAWVNNGIKYSSLSPKSELLPEQMSTWKQNILKLIDLGRVNLVKSERDLEELAWKHNIDLEDNEVDIAIKGINWGERETQTIDFTDMIYFPNVKQINMFKYDWVFIDECQDLNAAQRNLFLKCLKPNGRFVAVGDPRQAIYGFAGADVESFNLLKSLPNTVKLPLSVCYRCDTDIINMAKDIVPPQYNLSMDEIGTDEEKAKDTVLEEKVDGFTYKSIGGEWEFRLLYVLCKWNFCKCFQVGGTYKRLMIFGKKENIETVKWLRGMLAERFVSFSKNRFKEYKKTMEYAMKPISMDKYQRSYLMGCAAGLCSWAGC